MNWFHQIQWPGLTGLLEIALFAFAFFYVIMFFQGTRGVQILFGLAVVLGVMIVLTKVLRLDTVNWLVARASLYLAVALVIIFQPEIRRALAELGKPHVFASAAAERTVVEHIVQAALMLSERKIGALVAVEREIGTRAVHETGVKIDSVVTPELLASIFYPHTPLHDGGVLIRGNRLVAAGCMFPLSAREEFSKALGTRHRAAVGLTEETDALVVVISEETGTISVAYKGRLSRGLDEERLRRMLSAVLLKSPRPQSRMGRVKEQLDLTPEGVAKTDAARQEEARPNA
ncbi:MAG TPA: diadenylate cyclase CdaA [Kiritimatiellia bacterium]|nr:diadenylate cyclase CdaA [Kiritimatiellia bacterium]HRZ13148.1 diadenylate cyclase CdaA [Kiritimatiellia bacterium]HSA17569.1 diadenylate cyclase CdaA [Kiritimatiellia bacterium]